MDRSDAAVLARARAAYEIGRIGAAARRALWLAPLVAVALLGCASPAVPLACGAALVALVAGCLWRGEEWGIGVKAGIVGGIFPMLFPVGVRLTHPVCDATACYVIPAICAFGGVAAGVILGLLAPPPRAGRTIPFIVACVVAGLAGAVGCVLYGLIGVVVMAGGIAVGAVPVLAAPRLIGRS